MKEKRTERSIYNRFYITLRTNRTKQRTHKKYYISIFLAGTEQQQQKFSIIKKVFFSSLIRVLSDLVPLAHTTHRRGFNEWTRMARANNAHKIRATVTPSTKSMPAMNGERTARNEIKDIVRSRWNHTQIYSTKTVETVKDGIENGSSARRLTYSPGLILIIMCLVWLLGACVTSLHNKQHFI